MHLGEPDKVIEVPRPIKAPIIVPIPRRVPERVPMEPIRMPEKVPAKRSSGFKAGNTLEFQTVAQQIICPEKSCKNILKEKQTDKGLELTCPKHGTYNWDEIFKVKVVK
jgi:hypothetical protein